MTIHEAIRVHVGKFPTWDPTSGVNESNSSTLGPSMGIVINLKAHNDRIIDFITIDEKTFTFNDIFHT